MNTSYVALAIDRGDLTREDLADCTCGKRAIFRIASQEHQQSAFLNRRQPLSLDANERAEYVSLSPFKCWACAERYLAME